MKVTHPQQPLLRETQNKQQKKESPWKSWIVKCLCTKEEPEEPTRVFYFPKATFSVSIGKMKKGDRN